MTIRGLRARIKRIIHRYKHTKKVIREVSSNSKHLYYFGIPMHSNLGDLAQCICIRQFLKENYPEYTVIEIDSKVFLNPKSNLRKQLKEYIKPQDFIFFQSGYCTQDLGGVEDLMHQAVIQDYPDNRLIMLPQTVFFKTEQRRLQAGRIYNSHKHFLFLARDKVSFETAKEIFPDIPICLYPDIVTTLIGNVKLQGRRSGILMCMRNDVEKYYSDEEVLELRQKLSALDTVEIIDTTIKANVNAESPELDNIILAYIAKLSSARLVVTDRYHGTILSLAANTPVIVVRTIDHKVSTGVDWFKGVYNEAVFYADTLDNAEKLAEMVLKNNREIYNKPYFKEKYYDKLKDIIEERLGESNGHM